MSHKKKSVWLGFVVVIFFLSVALSLWGLMATGKSFLDACYFTLQLIPINGSFGDGPKVWQLELSRFILPSIGAYAALKGMLLLAGRHIGVLKVKFSAKNHYVICGLGDRGIALARDLLSSRDKNNLVVVIDINPSNKHVNTLIDLGGIFIEGNAQESSTLAQAAVHKSSHLILLTDKDATNLRILQVVKLIVEKNKNNRSICCHTHIANKENNTLFDDGGDFFPPMQNNINYSVFNVFENSAVALFQENTLGSNIDKLTANTENVNLLIDGFGRLGEAVLVEAMQLGHFCNQIPIAITVIDKNSVSAEKYFLHKYREVKNHIGDNGLKLWGLKFVSSVEDAGLLGAYTDILSCHDDEDDALVAINSLWERWQVENMHRNTRFFLNSPDRPSTSNANIHTFANYAYSCSKRIIIDKDLEVMARFSHEEYSKIKLKDNDPALSILVKNKSLSLNDALAKHDRAVDQAQKLSWQNLSLLKQAANLVEKRHYGVKLQSLGLKISGRIHVEVLKSISTKDFPWYGDLEASYEPNIIRICLNLIKVSEDELINKVHNLAISEHNRWNAFYILNNFRYGEKNERKKSHDCLLSWCELKKMRPDTLKYDYRNIYQIAAVLKLVDLTVCLAEN